MHHRLLSSVAASAALVLCGCGLQPLYGDSGTTTALSHIQVEASGGRTAFLLREKLDDQLARDRGDPALYRLDTAVRENRYPYGGRVNNVANRYEIGIQVQYRLIEIASRRELRRGSVNAQVTYDSADPPYAGVAAQQSGEERVAAEAAVLLRLELARFFARLPPR